MTHIKDAKPGPLTAGTPTPDDALREARADAKHWQAQFEAAHWERAEIRQALDAARAETEAVRKENGLLRAALAHSDQPCAYCSLPADQWARCQSGFPGCARADDAMGCPHLGASLEAEDLRSLAAELVEAIEAAGAMPEGFCCCSENRIGDDSKIHQPECRDVRASLVRARALGIGEEKNATKDGRTE